MKNQLILCCLYLIGLFHAQAQEKWTCFTDDKLLLVDDHEIKGVFEHTDGNLWFVTDRGIDIYDGTGWSRIDKDNKLMRKSLGAFMVDSKKRIWIGTGSPEFYMKYYGTGTLYKGGLLVNEGGEWTPILTKDIGIKIPIITQIFEQSNGDIWVGTSSVDPGMEEVKLSARGAILRFSNDEWTIFKFKDLPCLSCEYVKGFYEDKNGRLWLWGAKGITYFHDGKFHRVAKEDGYLKGGRRITKVYEDRNKNFWVAGFGRVARYDGNNWTTFVKKQGIPSSEYPPMGLTESNDGQMLLTARNGIYKYDGKETWSHEKKKYVGSGVFSDSKGRLWISTYKGLEIQDGANSTVDKDIKGIWKFIEDKRGAVWAFTGKDGVRRFKDGQWTHYSKKNELPSDRIRFVHLTDDGVLWIATNKGICKCEDE